MRCGLRMLYAIFMYSRWIYWGALLELTFVPYFLCQKKSQGSALEPKRGTEGNWLFSGMGASLPGMPARAPLDRVGVPGILKKLFLHGYCCVVALRV